MKGLMTVQLYDDWLFSKVNNNFTNLKIDINYLPKKQKKMTTLDSWDLLRYDNRIRYIQLNFVDP